jgi:hypothetical protein
VGRASQVAANLDVGRLLVLPQEQRKGRHRLAEMQQWASTSGVVPASQHCAVAAAVVDAGMRAKPLVTVTGSSCKTR